MTYPTLRFLPADHPADVLRLSYWLGKGLTREQAQHAVASFAGASVMLSECGTYQVDIKPQPAREGWPAMVHLSIKRRDREPIGDWRVLQAIKTAIVGAETEAVELYPAESRLVDTANQYHLWALADPGLRFPFGFECDRVVHDAGEGPGARLGAKQRPLAEAVR